MNAQEILKADLLDIVFHQRNKAYGAYALRRSYPLHMLKALAAMLATTAAVMAISSFTTNANADLPDIVDSIPDISIVTVVIDPPTLPAMAKKVSIVRPITDFPITIVPDKLFVEPKKPVEPATDPGPELLPAGNASGAVESGNGNGQGNILSGGIAAPAAPVSEPEDHIFTTTEVEASFPGGKAAWKRYLETRLDANVPVDNGAPAGKYTVIVSFVVDKQGNLSDVVALQVQPYGMAEEAIRIIKRGPKWNPAKQNGRNVHFRQQQSITFTVAEE